MRDSQVRIAQEISRRREELLYAQFEFLQIRQRAAEDVLLASSLWQRVLFLWNPEFLKDVVDARHHVYLNQAKAEKDRVDAAARLRP